LTVFVRSITFCSLLLCVCVFAIAQDAPEGLSANQVFRKDCAKCHGKNGEGRRFGGPSLVSEKTAGASADDLRNAIVNGKGRMPSFAGRLTPEQVDTLVRQIQAANKPQ